MKRPRIKKVASRVPENVTGNGLAFALDQRHQIEKHDVVEPKKAFSEGDETNDEIAVSYTHLRAHETVLDLVCRLLLEKKHNTSRVINIHFNQQLKTHKYHPA